MMALVSPSVAFKDSFISAVREFQADTEFPFSYRNYKNLSVSKLEKNFSAYVEKKLSQARGENLSPGFVPQTDYWLIDDNEFIGRVSIRHKLNEHLRRIGGHVGYDIRPSRRRQGYGSAILALALPKAKELGLNRVLITCDEANGASRKIIEKNGGIFENTVDDPEHGTKRMRFLIDLR